MDTVNADAGQPSLPETEAERRARFAWEAERIAEADASLAAGYHATSDEVDAWPDSLGIDRPLPAPYPPGPEWRPRHFLSKLSPPDAKRRI